MGADQIRDAALMYFASHGYEGTSLREIAEEAGIKKPSIYAHYKGKEDLFIQVVRYAFEQEQRNLLELFRKQGEAPLQERMKALLIWLNEEYSSNPAAKFMLRVAYFPPASLQGEIMDIVYPFLDRLERGITRLIQREIAEGKLGQLDPQQAAIALMTLLDGVIVELLYAGSKPYFRRLEAAWPIFWKGLEAAGNE
ncbi:TetR/AcrR family transcriptional regulator [Paenibacillus sp. JX-17]|uniref:TetR/AcrR family transcriptional regulator n=1 Tax=Paenibacillus lacisoli TaxID=3064525 RepID=A0ABT9CC91_9BACL|nr:TetR/AcrR family transcriptional regulator [Paenibacillus sp. JX-17]MDO7906490.1 TetR/AcrR family transcriptional regulator [Paenibacillus sp. JX-17]